MERWKDIKCFENLYQISNEGKVKSLGNGFKSCGHEKILKPGISTSGYLFVNLYKDKTHLHKDIHRLVALMFIPNPENKPCVNHKNGIKTDNNVNNLEWCTYYENNNHAYKMGLHNKSNLFLSKNKLDHKGSKNPQSKLKEKEVIEILSIDNMPLKKIAEKYNVSVTLIFKIRKRELWKHVNVTKKSDKIAFK